MDKEAWGGRRGGLVQVLDVVKAAQKHEKDGGCMQHRLQKLHHIVKLIVFCQCVAILGGNERVYGQ